MSKRLVLLVCIVMILGILSAPAVFADIIIMANESCRTELLQPDTNRHDSSKLSIRTGDGKGAKSWVKFDLGDLDVGNLETATLTVALHEPKGGNQDFDVSCVNDDCLDNIGWDERSITWNNAPGNNTAGLGALDTSKTTLLTTVNFTDGAAGDPFTIDVLEILEADTDGIVQFVFHNSDNLLNLATHDHAQETWRPFIDATKGAKGQAKKPYPAKDATEVSPTPVLSWKPGEFAAPTNGHKVYFSENFNDVNDGIGAITQDANSYAPAQRLDFGKTYYWRVDEVNGPPDYTVHEGRVWSFTTEPVGYAIENITATASSTSEGMGPENTINSSGLDANDLHSTEATDMWLSGEEKEPNRAWIEYELDKVHKLHEMWVWNSNQAVEPTFGLGCKDVSIEYSVNGTDYTTLGTTHEFVRAPGLEDYAHNTTVDLNDIAAKYVRLKANSNWGSMDRYGLSEVRFFSIPVQAREPSPDSGKTDVALDVTLGFRAGREADKHDVYFNSDEQVVIDGNVPVATVAETSYGPLSLDLGTTYYWKINEVNDAETPTTWHGDIWNFTTHEFFIVDGFEDYNDWPPDEIWATWIDGYDDPTNGATVGYPAPDWDAGEHYVETAIVYGGSQSMPFFYSNTGAAAYSEGKRTFALPQDWTKAGVQTLVLHFLGTPGNTGQLYVKVNDSKKVYDGNATDIAKPLWNQWSIDLASLGVDLLNVTTLAIGIEGNGASGTLYFDGIRLALSFPATGVRSGSIVFVSSLEAEHMPGDDAIKAFFEGLGHAVTYIDDDADEASTEAAAAAADLVYISESVGSGDIKDEITEIETPIIVAEPYAWDEMGLTTANPEAIDQVPASVNITIINAAHPMAAGYSGDVPVFTALSGSNELIPVGTTGGGAVVIARGSGNVQTDADVYFVYEKGAALAAPPADGSPQVAADIRIGFFTASPTAEELLSNEGYDLLRAAVNYALGMTE